MPQSNGRQEKRNVRHGGDSVSSFLFFNGRAVHFAGLTSCSRPGILVLINDADWELEGEDLYELKTNDNVLFVSTLHGG